MKKRFLKVLIVMLIGLFSVSTNLSFASEEMKTLELDKVAKELGITENELKELEQNIQRGLQRLEMTALDENNSTSEQKIKISENLTMDITTELKAASNTKTIVSTNRIKNNFGKAVVTMKATGVFQTDRTKKTSRAIDAYGSVHAWPGWKVSTSSAKGSTSQNAYARVKFQGTLTLHPINSPLTTFTKTCTITCNYNQQFKARWS